jgi:hypothetical protein
VGNHPWIGDLARCNLLMQYASDMPLARDRGSGEAHATLDTVTPARGFEVNLPPMYVVQRRHVDDALKGIPGGGGGVTVWVHGVTGGFDDGCFQRIERVSRILVRDDREETQPTPSGITSAAALGMVFRKLRAYEPGLADLIVCILRDINVSNSVDDHAFEECRSLTEVVLPRSIATIGVGAFRECSALKALTLPSFLTFIDDHAFENCMALREVVLPNELTHVGVGAFSGCTALTTMTLPNSLTCINAMAFQMCVRLTAITLPNSLARIGEGAFVGCISLTTLTLPNSLSHIGSGAFMGCTRLTEVTMSASLTHIDAHAFQGCAALPAVTLPASLTEIGEYAFCGCTTLARVRMPAVRPYVWDGAFQDCPWSE